MGANANLERVLAARIRRARKDMQVNGQRVTQAAFAERVKVHWVTVSNWETGNATPSIENLMSIARETGKPLSFFTDGDDDEEDEESLRRIAAFLLTRQDDGLAADLLRTVQRMRSRREARARAQA